MNIKNKKVLVMGLQRSGMGAALLLERLGASVTVTDMKSLDELRLNQEDSLLKLLGKERIKIKAGGHNERDFLDADLIVISPGVRTDMPLLEKARQRGIEVIGELELAYRVARAGLTPVRRDIPFYAITGTNGKSTVTTLLGLMLKEQGIKVSVSGNIGKALTMDIFEIIEGMSSIPDAFVVEVSSFQLETIKDFRPSIATILNITPDHLDRYSSMEQYREAKALIGLNMKKGDFLVLNGDDEEVMRLSDRFSCDVVYFSRRGPVKGACVDHGGIRLEFKDKHLIINLQGMRIKGVHNIENAMAASLMAFIAGAQAGAIEKTLTEFRGLEHRTEFVEEIDGVNYINDSKGTNIGALMKSLEGFYNVILIAGGRDKKGDFTVLRPLVKERVKALILIGEAREKIMKSLGDLVPTLIASDMKDAVYRARSVASPGDTVLLSPGCASFDMFRDFEDRGRVFKDIVRGLKSGIRKD